MHGYSTSHASSSWVVGSRRARTKSWPRLYFSSFSHGCLDELCYMYPTSHILLHASMSGVAMASSYGEEERRSVSQQLEAGQVIHVICIHDVFTLSLDILSL
jgi:hypothetical protein